jgi:hypothetical protein
MQPWDSLAALCNTNVLLSIVNIDSAYVKEVTPTSI